MNKSQPQTKPPLEHEDVIQAVLGELLEAALMFKTSHIKAVRAAAELLIARAVLLTIRTTKLHPISREHIALLDEFTNDLKRANQQPPETAI